MKKYGVSKQYGHFVQVWHVEAESKKEAWDIAELKGTLQYQTVYKEINPLMNYVTCLDDNIESNTIPSELYEEWLKEAKELGMIIDGYCGLPFNDIKKFFNK